MIQDIHLFTPHLPGERWGGKAVMFPSTCSLLLRGVKPLEAPSSPGGAPGPGLGARVRGAVMLGLPPGRWLTSSGPQVEVTWGVPPGVGPGVCPPGGKSGCAASGWPLVLEPGSSALSSVSETSFASMPQQSKSELRTKEKTEQSHHNTF